MTQFNLFLLALTPALTFPAVMLAYGRRHKIKRADIQRITGSPTIRNKYTWAYGPASPEVVFERTTSWPAYIVPLALNILTTTLFVTAYLAPGTTSSSIAPELQAVLSKISSIAIAGFAGSYLWSHYDLLRRFTTFDLSPSSLYLIWLRLVAGALAGPALSAALADALRTPIAFAVGAFPLGWIQSALRGVARQRLKGVVEELPCETATLQILQGASAPIIERLEEESITSTQHLALADPLRLFLRTNLELTVILDLIDQAALHLYVGGKLTDLRAVGIRSAIEFAEVRDYIDSDKDSERKRGNELVDLIAARLSIDTSAVLKLIDSLYYDPQVSFVWDLWGEAFGTAGDQEIKAGNPRDH